MVPFQECRGVRMPAMRFVKVILKICAIAELFVVFICSLLYLWLGYDSLFKITVLLLLWFIYTKKDNEELLKDG